MDKRFHYTPEKTFHNCNGSYQPRLYTCSDNTLQVAVCTFSVYLPANRSTVEKEEMYYFKMEGALNGAAHAVIEGPSIHLYGLYNYKQDVSNNLILH